MRYLRNSHCIWKIEFKTHFIDDIFSVFAIVFFLINVNTTFHFLLFMKLWFNCYGTRTVCVISNFEHIYFWHFLILRHTVYSTSLRLTSSHIATNRRYRTPLTFGLEQKYFSIPLFRRNDLYLMKNWNCKEYIMSHNYWWNKGNNKVCISSSVLHTK